MLFGEFSAADAYFAPVCMRFNTYQLPLHQNIIDYVGRVTALPAVQVWIKAALAEKDSVAMDEPYRIKS